MGDIAHQLGIAEESVYGTIVTPNRFYEFVSESLSRDRNMRTSEGIRAGRRYGGQGRAETRQWAGGTIDMEVPAAGFGVFFEHLLGGVATTQPGTLAFQHVFTPGTVTGKSLTIQKGVDTISGTVEPFTYQGSKIVGIDLSNDQDGLLRASIDVAAQAETTATALAAASYTTPEIFTYAQGTVKIDDVAVGFVRSVGSFRIANNFREPRFFLGSGGLQAEPVNVPFDEISGSLDVEFQDPADIYDLYVADTPVELTLEYVGPEIEAGHNYTLSVVVADARFEGESPQVDSPDLVYQDIPFVGLDPASGAAVEVTYITTDATP